MPRFLPVLLAFCMFSTGASGLVNEYVLATITTYILGNSIEQFSIVIASMMLMMGLAGLVQTKMSDEHLMYKFVTVEVLMALMGGFAPLVVYAAYGYMNSHFLVVHYFFVLAVGFLIGFEIPIVMRIVEKNKIKLKSNLAIVYAMDYVGAFIGAIIWVKFLLKTFPLTEISFIVAGFNFVVTLITLVYFLQSRFIKVRLAPIVAIIVTICMLIVGFLNNRDLSDLFEQQFYEDPIVYKTTTKYQHLVITKNEQLGDVRLYINGNTQFSSLDEKRYHDLLVHPVMTLADEVKNILILGGGDGLALREVIKYKNVENITLVDLDPEMIKIAATNEHLRKMNNDSFSDARIIVRNAEGVETVNVKGVYLESDEVTNYGTPKTEWVASIDVYNLDADQFVNNKSRVKWDVVIIDLPDPSSVELAKLYSKQFFKKLKNHLSPDVYVSIQSTSPYHAKEAFLTIGSTLKAAGFSALPYRQNIPSFGDWGYYIAWLNNRDDSSVLADLSQTESFEVETDFITPELMAAAFVFGKGELDSANNCINTTMHPCLLTQYADYSWKVN